MRCPRCGAENPATNTHCSLCHAPLSIGAVSQPSDAAPVSKRCPRCGAPVTAGLTICPRCASPID